MVVVVTITKIKYHRRMDAEDADHVGDMVVHINVCNLITTKIHPMELIGWRISSMNQNFMPIFWQNRKPDYMNYATTEAPPPLSTPNAVSVESRLLQLEQLASTLTPPQSIVASHQGVSQVGVQSQYTNSTNPALQRLNQRH